MSGARIQFGFIPLPMAIVDEGIDLTLGEYRLLGYLLRHRFRIKSEKMRIAQDELLNGVRKPDGSRYDRGCLISSNRDLKAARERLEARGWLKVTKDADESYSYEVCVDDTDEPSANCIQEPGANCTQEPGANCTQVPGANCTQVPGANCTNTGCNLHEYRVQNAPSLKEEKREERRNTETPLRVVSIETASAKSERSVTDAIFVLPSWVDAAAWREYEAMRKRLKAPLTDGARRRGLADLEKLRDQGHSPTAVLQQSADKCWKGFFPVKGQAVAVAPPASRRYRETDYGPA